MGVGTSKEEEARLKAAIHKLSKVEIKQIEGVFQELSFVDNNGKRLIKRPTWLDRENFAVKFGLPDFLGEQLFAAFDKDHNEVVDMNEFLAGVALCLHGNIKDKCRLLFKIFNLDDDEGITHSELTTVLSSSLQSAHGVLSGYLKDEQKGTVGWDMKIAETVERIVNDAFETCDTSKNGKLEIEEFEHWVHKNPKLINNIFLISCPKPEESEKHYDVIETPVDETKKLIFEYEHQASPKEENRKLSDLFGNQQVAPTDREGQSFFDTIGGSVGKDTDEPVVGGSIRKESDPSKDVLFNVITETIQEPNIPPNAEEILHHLHVSLDNEQLVSHNSDLSLVSLGQSTGDLSSLDAENSENGGNEKGGDENVEEEMKIESETVGENIISEDLLTLKLLEPGNEVTEVRDDIGESKMNLNLDLSLVSGEVQSGLKDAKSPWHPLKPEFGKTEANDEEKEDEFQDASDVVQSEMESEVTKTKLGNKTQDDEIHDEVLFASNPDFPTKPESAVNLSKPNVSGSETDSVFNRELQTSFEEIPEPVIEDETFHRPSSLDVGEQEEMTDVDLTPGDHAIGKPTLRQLAEMKEFDKSPSLEDKNSSLPEIRLAAWLPSTQTKEIIESINRGVTIDKTFLTYPAVLLETSLGDPVKDLVHRFLGEQEAAKRPVPTADNVTMNDAGLKSLLKSQCWRGAVDWTAKYLTAHGQGVNNGSPTGPFNHTPKLLQIWFVRIALLFKLKSFSSAEAELNAFGDFENPDLFYEYYPSIYPGMRGSMVPFSLRVIHAELPQHNGRPQETLDRSYHLLAKIKKVLENLEKGLSEHGEEIEQKEEVRLGVIQLWQARELRILYAIGNCLLSIKEYNLAMKIFSEIIEKNPGTKSAILSGIGRLHLQLGDIQLAKKYFKKVEQISLGDPKTLSITVMNRGFSAFAEGKYNEAFENFQSVTKLDPDNSSACNNASVALLFQGKVKEACTLLETLIWKSPKKNLHEDIVFNLCTIYELHRTTKALQKKHKLLDLVCRHKGDGFNVQSLKLT